MNLSLKIAWLEQSGIIEDRELTIRQTKKFAIDFYRYNWKQINDPIANVHPGLGLSWSKGRENLFAN